LNIKGILKHLLLFCCLSHHSFIWAKEANIISYQHLSINDGLASKQIHCGLQDSRGFVWIGTGQGLQRYDGENFKNFSTDNSRMRANVVSKIIEDDQERLWIMYELRGSYSIPSSTKVDILDLKTNKIKPFEEVFKGKYPFNAKLICNVYSNNRKQIVIVTYETLAKGISYDKVNGFKKLPCEILSSNFGYKTAFYINDHLIYSTNKNLMECYNLKAKKIIHNIPFDKKNKILKAINLDHSNRLLFSENIFSDKPTFQYWDVDSASDQKALQPLPSNSIEEKHFDNQYSSNAGYVFLNKENEIKFINGQESFSLLKLEDIDAEANFIVYNFFVSSSNQLWICTSNGLFIVHIKSNRFKNYHYTTKENIKQSVLNQVRNVFTDEQNNLIVNAWGGIFKYDLKKPEIQKPITIKPMTVHGYNYYGAYYADSQIWHYIDYNIGIERLNVYTKENQSITKDYNFWAALKIDQCLLFSTKGRIMKIENNQATQLPFSKEEIIIPNETSINQFYKTKDGKVWAVGDNGLYEINSDWRIVNHYTKEQKEQQFQLPYTSLNAIYEDKKGLIWMASAGGGLFQWNRKKNTFIQYTKENGLSSNLLYGILQDELGYLWISSDNGLMRFDPLNLLIKKYGLEDGLTQIEFNRMAFHKASDGRMFFGGINGVNTFFPADFTKEKVLTNTPLKVINFQQFDNEKNQLLDLSDAFILNPKIVLKPGDKFFSLEFQLLEFQQGNKNYAYKIEGIDEEWNIIGSNYLRLSGLPYGKYILKVKAQNTEGVWSEDQLSIPIEIITPFYKTLGFIFFSIFTLSLFLFLGYNFRIKRLMREKEKLEKTVAERTEKLSLTLKQKEILLKEIHHRVKNNLSVISSLLELQSFETNNPAAKEALLEGQNRVASIALIHQKLYQTDHLASLDFKDFISEMYVQIAIIFKKKDQNIDFHITAEGIQLDIDTAVPLGLIINELISNSFKYAFKQLASPQIQIHLLKLADSSYLLEYTDNGPGLPIDYDFEKSNSLGLRLIRSLAKQLSGKASYEHKHLLTKFTISFKDSKTREQE
jgi:two-component sensor histidine kinase